MRNRKHIPALDPYFKHHADLFPTEPEFLGYHEHKEVTEGPDYYHVEQIVSVVFYNHTQTFRWAHVCTCGNHVFIDGRLDTYFN